MPSPTSDFIPLADTVLDRERFGAIFDDTAKGRTNFAFKLLALMDLHNPIAKALSHAQDNGFLDPLVERLWHANQFDGAAVAASPQALAVSVRLQGFTRPAAGITNTEAETKSTSVAMRRLCSIRVMNNTGMPVKTGSGFLVGPQTVITSHHVIKPLLDAQNAPLPGSDQRLKITFDAVNGMTTGTVIKPQEAWLVECSPSHPLEDTEQLQALDLDATDPTDFDNYLDYAVIRLSRTAGRERGFYTLDPARYPTISDVGAQVTLWQFQGDLPLATARGVGSRLWPKPHESRLHHDANSSDGSSGGLIVDQEFKPVGLHQCGFRDAANNPVFNGAIPTACIAKRGTGLQSIVGLDAMWRLESTNEPVVGREAFQSAVLEAIVGTTRILAISGAPKTGRTFTTKILREMLGTAQHDVVEMSASHLDVTAHETAMKILSACGAQQDAALPQPEATDTAQGAWIRDELFPAFVRRVRARSDQRGLWLVIDDIDRFKIANTSTRIFLETLYSGLASLPELRIVLIGLEGDVPGANPQQVVKDRTREFDQVEMQDYLQRSWNAQNPEIDGRDARPLVQGLLLGASDDPLIRQASLAAALVKAARGA